MRIDHQMWAAARVVAMHTSGSGCGQCNPAGCALHEWAAGRLAAWEAEHHARCPDQAPGWSAVAHSRR